MYLNNRNLTTEMVYGAKGLLINHLYGFLFREPLAIIFIAKGSESFEMLMNEVNQRNLLSKGQ